MSVIRTIDDEVKDRLDSWGMIFSLSRPIPLLGHQSKNLLQVLIEHEGEFPARATGFRPELIDLDAWEIEQFVGEVFHDSHAIGWCMRAFWCGSGRRGVERYELAKELVGQRMSRGTYYGNQLAGFNRVLGMVKLARQIKMPFLTKRPILG